MSCLRTGQFGSFRSIRLKKYGVIASAIPEYGVVAYITQTSQTGGTFFLYKHA